MADYFSLLFLPQAAEAITYKTDGRGPALNIPLRERDAHGNRLLATFQRMWEQVEAIRSERVALGQASKDGTYIEFKGEMGFDLVTKSLENFAAGIRLLNVRQETVNDLTQTFATVFVPRGKEGYFIQKIRKYITENYANTDNPKNANLVESIQDVGLAVLESFWTDPRQLMPEGQTTKKCELWLRTIKGQEIEAIERAKQACELLEIDFFEEKLINFPERSVVLIRSNRSQLIALLEACADVAEIRVAREAAGFWVTQPNIEQTSWTVDVLKRIKQLNTNIGVCILDTGVNNGHPLIAPVLADADCNSYNPAWGVTDHDGHGTMMSGVVTYGSLEEALASGADIELSHKISSVKILPPSGANDPDLYGAITQQAISIAEIKAPQRKQIFCCAVTSALIDHKGKPTSYSGAIDATTSGQADGVKRLFIVSTGNVRNLDDWNAYPGVNLLRSVEDPAQSWNSLTVGAYTEKVHISDPALSSNSVVAPARGLSPYSTSSTLWDGKWPVKPDIVLEGGNLRKTPEGHLYENYPDLSVLTTSNEPVKNQFDTIYATSAATAKASWMAAKIHAQYPNIWPETIKGLMVHSAEWPDAIIDQYELDINRKNDVLKLMRICGYGVPDIAKALYCSKSVLTMVSQEEIQPFFFKSAGTPSMKDMHLYELPWPKDLLLAMGAIQVKLRVTLSYFIEPGPGEIGWKEKYRYASHGLRFDVNNINESKSEFAKRLNIASRAENEQIQTSSGSERWVIGANNRSIGSIHSDIWQGNAADIATCNRIGVYPVVGWWRERKHLGYVEKKARYSLIVSLITPEQNVDIYTPIETALKVQVTV